MKLAVSIEAQPLTTALDIWAEQTGLMVMVPAEGGALITPRVVGSFTPEEALIRLLEKSGYRYEFVNAGTVAVNSEREVSAASGKETGANVAEVNPALRVAWSDTETLQQAPSHDSAAASSGNGIEEVTVTAAPYRFLDADTSGTTNLPLPIEAVPQSITLLSSDFMRAAGITKESDLARYEAGVKSRQFNGMLLLTAAAFRLEQKNSPAFAGIGDLGDYFRAQGEVRHQGVELEARGLLTPSLTVSAAVTYLDAQITADRDASLVGKRRLFRPREMASAFVVKGFDGGMLRGFNVGGGAMATRWAIP